jgi:hypothetical protein
MCKTVYENYENKNFSHHVGMGLAITARWLSFHVARTLEVTFTKQAKWMEVSPHPFDAPTD